MKKRTAHADVVELAATGQSRPISRVLYRQPEGGGDDHSSRTYVTVCLKRPNPEASGEQPCSLLSPVGKSGIASLFGLAPGGVYRAPDVTIGTGALLPHRFTLTGGTPSRGISVSTRPRRSVFCGTFLRVTPTGRYPAPCSLEPGLSSLRRQRRAII